MISQGITNIYECMEELSDKIPDKESYYLSKLEQRWMECGDTYLDSMDEILDRLLSIDMNEDNFPQINKLVHKLTKIISSSYRGFLDTYNIAKLYELPTDQLYESVKHLYD